VENHNFEGFPQDVIYLLENHELARNLGKEALKFVAPKYFWEKVAENVEFVYYALLDIVGT
jgi:glycosyltransferase involved in cell wall biosynthesis